MKCEVWKILFLAVILEVGFILKVLRIGVDLPPSGQKGHQDVGSQKYHERLVSPSWFWVLMVHNRFLDTIRIAIELQFGPAASNQSWETIATFGQADFQKIPSPHLSISYFHISPTFESFFVKKNGSNLGWQTRDPRETTEIQVQGILLNVKTIQPFREDKKIEFAINHVPLHEKMYHANPKQPCYLHAIWWIQNMFTLQQMWKKNDVWRESMFSKKTIHHFILEKSPGFPSKPLRIPGFAKHRSGWGRDTRRLFYRLPEAAAFRGPRGVVWMGASSISIKWGSTIRDSPFGMAKTTCLLVRDATLRDGHSSSHLFYQKASTQNVNVYINNIKQPFFKPLCPTCMSTCWHWKLPSFDPTSLQDLSVSMPPRECNMPNEAPQNVVSRESIETQHLSE